jgi:VWFA-related protein
MVLSLGFLPFAAVAQSGLPAFVEHIEVQQVNLEVFAVTSDGRPVTDLTAADLKVLDDGKPVALLNFSHVGASSRPGDAPGGREGRAGTAGEPGEPAAPAYLVILLDELHMGATSRSQLFADLSQTLTRRLPRGARVLVARYETSTQILQPFTADAALVQETLAAALKNPSALQLQGDQDRQQTLDAIQQDVLEGPCLYGDQLALTYAQRKRSEVLDTIGALDRLVGTLDGLPGRKAILYVSNGLPLRPGEEALDTYIELCGGTGASRGAAVSMDTATMGDARLHRPDPTKLRMESNSFDTSERWRGLAAKANGQGVSLYSLISGEPPRETNDISAGQRGGPSVTTLATAAVNQTDAMVLLATETGAQILHSGAALDERLASMIDDLGNYYLLGYAAPNAEVPRLHQLRVEVGRPGVTLRYRQSYALKTGEQKTTDRLLTRLYYDVGENPLGLNLALAPPGEAVKGRSVPGTMVRLRVPLGKLTLLNQGGAARGSIAIYLVARDEGGHITPVRRKAIPLNVSAADLAADPRRTWTYEVAMPLHKGRNEVAVAVRDELSGETSFDRETFTVKR